MRAALRRIWARLALVAPPAAETIAQLGVAIPADRAAAWLDAPNPAAAGQTPAELAAHGFLEQARALARRDFGGAS